jgi:hypothetical protein
MRGEGDSIIFIHEVVSAVDRWSYCSGRSAPRFPLSSLRVAVRMMIWYGNLLIMHIVCCCTWNRFAHTSPTHLPVSHLQGDSRVWWKNTAVLCIRECWRSSQGWLG